ncbi:MAG: KUP/HAK/KT family potassium transporter [Candidatus Gastranaerophilales bacterium]|nr:KUP/HAK/KT family potassium transporter [Candidatus Gastranaerophilales bacterium]
MVFQEEKTSPERIIKAMGLVFGDIGTSPIYTFTVIFLTTAINYKNVIGILSLIIWTLLLVVTAQYTWLAMSLSKKGEGGAIVLNEIMKRLVKPARGVAFFSLLTYIGISLLIGDSVITPAISILSAVEGLTLIDTLKSVPQWGLLLITILITLGLFSIQKKGTEKISQVFGPIMLIWFIALGTTGLWSFSQMPGIIQAFNPFYGIDFVLHNGFAGFFVLSEVILCATGAEALYADMGHLGRKPITYAWGFICIVLIINYLGQGAFLLEHPEAKNILFSMISYEHKIFYIPFLITSIFATIIASQAMISGLFSIVYQGINTRIFPLFKIKYTSDKIGSQIYIGTANWFLLFFVILVILFFKKSSNLAAAYGLAVTGTISITAIMMCVIFFLRKMYLKCSISLFLLSIDLCFLGASCLKIPHGAYWSIIIAIIPLSLILLYTKGNQKLYKAMVLMKKDVFLNKYNKIYPNISKIKGTALFFSRGVERISPYIIQTMFTNNIVFTENIFVQVSKTGEAYGVSHEMTEVAEGLLVLKFNVGYMTVFNLEENLKKLKIKEKAIFYGAEEIETENPIWHIFAIIKKITPSFISFYNLPTHKVHGVITKIKIK